MEPLLPSHICNLVFLKSQLSIWSCVWSPYTIPSITVKDKMYKHLTDKTIFVSNFFEEKAILRAKYRLAKDFFLPTNSLELTRNILANYIPGPP